MEENHEEKAVDCNYVCPAVRLQFRHLCVRAINTVASSAPTVQATAETVTEKAEDEFVLEVYNTSSINSGVSMENYSVNNKYSLDRYSICCYVESTDTMLYSDRNKLYQKNGDTMSFPHSSATRCMPIIAIPKQRAWS